MELFNAVSRVLWLMVNRAVEFLIKLALAMVLCFALGCMVAAFLSPLLALIWLL